MNVTRRGLARVLTISAAVPMKLAAQARAVSSDAVASSRDEYREAAQALAAVKLSRSTEPATRFEA